MCSNYKELRASTDTTLVDHNNALHYVSTVVTCYKRGLTKGKPIFGIGMLGPLRTDIALSVLCPSRIEKVVVLSHSPFLRYTNLIP